MEVHTSAKPQINHQKLVAGDVESNKLCVLYIFPSRDVLLNEFLEQIPPKYVKSDWLITELIQRI